MFLVNCLFINALSAQVEEVAVGRRKSIDINNVEVLNVFKTVVEERGLKFVELEEATQQIVSGFIYQGVCKVVENDVNVRYMIKIWIKPGAESKEVMIFEKIDASDSQNV